MRILNDRWVIQDQEPPRQGGMAEVRRAIDGVNGGCAAVKIFPAFPTPHDEIAFDRELQSLQKLAHPNVVKLLDGGRDSESKRRFLVLEWLESSLVAYLKENPLAGWDSFYQQIGRPILLGLVYAFSQGIRHRDIKPDNIMMTADGTPRITDFGIAKIVSQVGIGRTMADFRTPPYAPPEPEDSRYVDQRDVYGFAVLLVECMAERRLRTYDEVEESLNEFDNEEVGLVLQRAMERDPRDRISNVAELLTEIDSLQLPREQHHRRSQTKPTCTLCLTRAAYETLSSELGVPEGQIDDILAVDLHDAAVKIKQPKDSHEKEQVALTIFGAEFMYGAFVDADTRSFLVVHYASPRPPHVLDLLREGSFDIDVALQICVRGAVEKDGAEVIRDLIGRIAEHEYCQDVASREIDDDLIFKKWLAVLHAKRNRGKANDESIRYELIGRQGSRATLKCNRSLPEELVGQSRLIRLSQYSFLAGEVESIRDGKIGFWIESGDVEKVPARGILEVDFRAEQRSIDRQMRALDRVRFRRAAAPQLREILIAPEKARTPRVADGLSFVDKGLDESKRSAVRASMGSDALTLVEGPPGTGKTRFITEVVLQAIRRNPRIRILLVSQTHVALDNALERIREADSARRMLRIGRKGDPRISSRVEDLMVENRLRVWQRKIRKSSHAYVQEFAEQEGVDIENINLGMAVAKLRSIRARRLRLQARSERVSASVTELMAIESSRAIAGLNDGFDENNERIEVETETREDLTIRLKRARAQQDEVEENLVGDFDIGAELVALSDDELLEWENELLKGNPDIERVHRYFQLVEDWHLRLGGASDFLAGLIADAEIVAGTCVGIGGIHAMQEAEFDLCIVDEASKATATELLIPMSKAKSWIVIGDRKQLPPHADGDLDDDETLQNLGIGRQELRSSLLDHLCDALPSECVSQLTEQHRMVREIGDLISTCFYDGKLKSMRKSERGLLDPLICNPVTWLDTSSSANRREHSDASSYRNIAETKFIAQFLESLDLIAAARNRFFSVGVLTGYASQRDALDRVIDSVHRSTKNLEIECNTVDAFQGREVDIAIYSLTRSNKVGDLGFLRERRRANVALSRARFGLVIVGDAEFARLASGENPWRNVLEYIDVHPDDCSIVEA